MSLNPSAAVLLVVKTCLACRKSKVPLGKKRCTGACQKLCCQLLRSPSGACWSCVRNGTHGGWSRRLSARDQLAVHMAREDGDYES